jgi:EAL domain-containing protein (putative c-di-GMP-specific phosphodiesterase class I)/CheY-like chemotaxis protein
MQSDGQLVYPVATMNAHSARIHQIEFPTAAPLEARAGAVLLVDDDISVGRGLRRVLAAAGYEVRIATSGEEALDALTKRTFDVIVSDINMPGMSGISLLRSVRLRDRDVPIILMTGKPTLETAMEAIGLGAMQYLAKPMNLDELLKSVERASKLHQLGKLKRDALKLLGANAAQAGDRAALEADLDRALDTMWMAFQPIVDSEGCHLFAYEALMRSDEAALPHPGALLAAAERLDRLPDLGRRVRALSAAAFGGAPGHTLLFVNLHTRDLLDPDLYRVDAPLTQIADRVVLEVTERAALEDVNDVISRVASLRTLGFRVAIDDLGAGYAGLSSFVELQPEFVKLDMSLVRGVNTSAIRQRLIASLAALCKDLGMHVLAEGVETAEEHDAVRGLGCELLQGYFFARPGRPFPSVVGHPGSCVMSR